MRKCNKCGIEIYNNLGVCPSCFTPPPMPKAIRRTKQCPLCGEYYEAAEDDTICKRCKEFWMNMINRKCNTCEYGLYSTECVGCKHNPVYKDMYKPIGSE